MDLFRTTEFRLTAQSTGVLATLLLRLVSGTPTGWEVVYHVCPFVRCVVSLRTPSTETDHSTLCHSCPRRETQKEKGTDSRGVRSQVQ